MLVDKVYVVEAGTQAHGPGELDVEAQLVLWQDVGAGIHTRHDS